MVYTHYLFREQWATLAGGLIDPEIKVGDDGEHYFLPNIEKTEEAAALLIEQAPLIHLGSPVMTYYPIGHGLIATLGGLDKRVGMRMRMQLAASDGYWMVLPNKPGQNPGLSAGSQLRVQISEAIRATDTQNADTAMRLLLDRCLDIINNPGQLY